ncbi:MAG TPA: hypothetical protein VKW77_05650 [Acidimicrobiales bacterium]|nr:hypothetical protein [Acidimicrobiales bacterium]
MAALRRLALFAASALLLPACGAGPSAGAAPGFTMASPGNGAIGVDGTPVFSWSASSGATGYTLEVATDAGFGSPVVDRTDLAGTSFRPDVALNPGTVYFWRVFAVGPSGTVAADDSPFSFTTVAPTPGGFTMTGPADGALGVSRSPAFTWTSSLGAASYRLQVSADAGFDSPLLDLPGLGTTSAAPSVVLAPSTMYFWRVLAVSTATVVAAGAPFTFTTQAAPSALAPGSFTLLHPVSGADGVSVIPTFSWQPSSGAVSYRLEVARDPAFVDMSSIWRD